MEVHSDGPNSETIGGNGDFAEEAPSRHVPGRVPGRGVRERALLPLSMHLGLPVPGMRFKHFQPDGSCDQSRNPPTCGFVSARNRVVARSKGDSGGCRHRFTWGLRDTKPACPPACIGTAHLATLINGPARVQGPQKPS
jgi:hypothetical protein